MKTHLFLVVAGTLSAVAAQAHEFWIEPEDYLVARGEPVIAAIHVGQGFDGPSYAYIPQNFRRFDIAIAEAVSPVEMRIGDRPALDVTPAGEGLAVIVHVTRDYTLRYTDPATFRDFIEHKDAAWVLDRHAARGLPDTGFQERYSRHAKSLVAVGDGHGQDRAFGLLTEIVALANPYTDALPGGLPVQVLYEGAPRAGAQVEIFAKSGETVIVSTVNADAEGRAVIPVQPGHSYMLDSVVLREIPEGAADGVVWESLWANLTFAVPD